MAGAQNKDGDGIGGVFEALREAIGASNPGLVTREDMSRLEDRVEAIEQLVDELEDRIAAARKGSQQLE